MSVDSPKVPAQSGPDAQTPAPPPQAAADLRISIDDFLKVEMRTVRVVSAEKVPNSRKLLKLDVDMGTERRTVVAGIADAYEPDALVGKTCIMVANLKPAKLMGVESNGMILAASTEGGKPMLLQVDGDSAPGTRVR